MKIISKDSAYVQKIDISHLINSTTKIPDSIYSKIMYLKIDNMNKYEFIKFTDINEIKFFKNISWIVDYNDIKNLSEDEIIKQVHEIANNINKIADKFNTMTDKKKNKNEDLIKKCELYEYKMHSLRDALWFKQGHINIKLPDIKDYHEPKKRLNKIFK